MKIKDNIEDTLRITGLSVRGLARLLNMDPHTILNNQDKSWEELTPTTRLKFFVICTLVNRHFRLLTPEAIVEILNQHVYENTGGFRDSVLSALESSKYNAETIINIGQLAHNSYLERSQKQAASLPDAVSA